MTKGLVFGKFMPLHAGHILLINFALQHCDHLYIVLCYTANEPIEGLVRYQWISQSFRSNANITIISFEYDESVLPNTSVSSRDASLAWAKAFQSLVPGISMIFTSEDYGDYLAEYMHAKHISFDKERSIIPVSATVIRSNPLLYWNYIAGSAKIGFVKRIALVGSESTGKSVLTEKLARYYDTSFVPEMAREVVETTNECKPADLYKIAALHANEIQSKLATANKLLFVDTDLITTKSYSTFLFNEELVVDDWIEETNKFSLYLFLEPDCEYVQDGTRLSLEDRNALSIHHKKKFEEAGVPIISVLGNWDERFEKAIDIIDRLVLKKSGN
jgi:HTH-type transcriptional repressor of NAD biosynthesis genes